jgi:hypothetical protein
MKKLIVLFAFTLLSTIALIGQSSPDRRIENSKPQYLYISSTPYRFIYKGDTCIVSYDVMKDESEKSSRPVYVFCDSIKVTDAIQYDSYVIKDDGSEYKNFYWTGFQLSAPADSASVLLNNGNIAIFLANYRCDGDIKFKYATFKIVILIPNGNKFAHVIYSPVSDNIIELSEVYIYCEKTLSQIKNIDTNQNEFEIILNNKTIKFVRTK